MVESTKKQMYLSLKCVIGEMLYEEVEVLEISREYFKELLNVGNELELEILFVDPGGIKI